MYMCRYVWMYTVKVEYSRGVARARGCESGIKISMNAHCTLMRRTTEYTYSSNIITITVRCHSVDQEEHSTASKSHHPTEVHSLWTTMVSHPSPHKVQAHCISQPFTSWAKQRSDVEVGECKSTMMGYLKCLKLNGGNNGNCRLEAKKYLQCRMDQYVSSTTSSRINDLGHQSITSMNQSAD